MPDGMLRSFEYTLGFMAELVADVPDERWTEQPSGLANHAAWTVGHLAYSCQAIGGEMGLKPWLPGGRKDLFGTGSNPQKDRGRYPAASELLEEMRASSCLVCEHVRKTWATLKCQELPDARYRSLLPTVGDAVLQVLVAHSAYHVGQTALWRRAIGFPPPARFYL
ncbi:MAG: DinB family protein [Planctomycetes bacterium]|nr:DinB family protein [Planctomycetota bacterium]